MALEWLDYGDGDFVVADAGIRLNRTEIRSQRTQEDLVRLILSNSERRDDVRNPRETGVPLRDVWTQKKS